MIQSLTVQTSIAMEELHQNKLVLKGRLVPGAFDEWTSWHDWRGTMQWKCCDSIKIKHKILWGPSFVAFNVRTNCICTQIFLSLKQKGQGVSLVNIISLKRDLQFFARLLYSSSILPILLYPYFWILYSLTHSFYYPTKLW